MKKLLAIVLVFVLAGASFGANAGFHVTRINGAPYESQTPELGDILKIAAIADFNSKGVKAWHINDNGMDDALGVVGNAWLNEGYDQGRIVGDDAPGWMLYAPTVATNVNAFAGLSSPGPGVIAGQVAFAFDYVVPDVPLGTFIQIEVFPYGTTSTGIQRASDGVWFPIAPVSIIPEPMTMSLLALGGMGLLRRRG